MNPPKDTLRLRFRELQTSDAPHFYALNADPEVLRYTGDRPFATEAEARAFLKDYKEYASHGFGRWAVLLKESGDFIGWCGLKYNEEALVDLGFRFYKACWYKGYATEAARACLEYGFYVLQLEEIVARVAVANKASIRVLEKLEMTYWKETLSPHLDQAYYFRLTRTKYRSRNPV